MQAMTKLFCVLIVLIFARQSAFAVESVPIDQADKLPMVNQHVAVEAVVVELVLNNSSEVLQVAAAACERCQKTRYLPARNFRVLHDGAGVLPEALRGLSGSSATILINKATGMAEQVRFFAAETGESHEN